MILSPGPVLEEIMVASLFGKKKRIIIIIIIIIIKVKTDWSKYGL
jgi:hypothetical protein